MTIITHINSIEMGNKKKESYFQKGVFFLLELKAIGCYTNENESMHEIRNVIMRTLLIVEEDKRDRQALRAIIHKSGIQIDTILECSNGKDAVYALENQKIDVMFTNINMSGINGIDLCEKARQIDETLKIVAVTDSDEFIHAVQLLRLGAREYLLKPIQKKQVEDILHTLDNEVRISVEHQVTNSTVSGQQLKQMLLNLNASAGELDSIMKQSDSVLFKNSYVVCCLDNMGADSYMREERGYLGNVEQSEVYILKESILDWVRLQEWRRRFVGVSCTYIGIEHLQEAYREAMEARVEAFYREKSLVCFAELEGLNKEKASLDKRVEPFSIDIGNMSTILGTLQATKAIKDMNKFLWENKREKNITVLQSTITQFMEQIEVTYSVAVREDWYEIQNLKSPLSYASINVYEHMLLHWLELFVQKIQVQLSDFKNKEKMQLAIAYIRENYDQDFNMAVVSNEVSMNYSLFSIAFKEYTGTNFVNYLKELRMKKAKEYLKNSELRIGEISQRVGYENEKHFMKIFKAMYGVSPTEYRKSMKLSE